MKIYYLPNRGFLFNEKLFLWGTDRNRVRQELGNTHQAADNILEFEHSQIIQNRDIFQNFNHTDSYFFLNFDQQDRLEEMEVHWGISIEVENTLINFDEDIHRILNQFKVLSFHATQLEEGEYLFKDLKMVLADQAKMGGEGSGIAYFYASTTIDHLLE